MNKEKNTRLRDALIILGVMGIVGFTTYSIDGARIAMFSLAWVAVGFNVAWWIQESRHKHGN